jgi:16S rRNA (guanine527-N7)-methyltransferase
VVSRETGVPEPPDELPAWLQPHRSALRAFADILAAGGVERGLIGPREVPRLWERHLLNCAVVAEPAGGLVPEDALVADVGSGAGLPGVVWAIVRPDLTLVLVEPLLRRSTFLAEVVDSLGLSSRVQVLRSRAEDVARAGDWVPVDVVTARAVAPWGRLVGWTAPLVRRGGRVVAFKGSSAESEMHEGQSDAERMGLTSVTVLTLGPADHPTTVITAVRGAAP